jgi:hypothetical protein
MGLLNNIGNVSEIRSRLTNQLNQQPMAEISFFTPTRANSRGNKFTSDAHLLIAIKGKDRKGSAHIFYIKNLMKKYDLKWKYVRVGVWNENIYIEEGTSSDGYLINKFRDIANKDLVEKLFNGICVHYSNLENHSTTVKLGAKRFQKGFLLTTI